ncbi:MAG: TRAP transporter fused permease subunit, partial [Deltaproteobacteria bacterium]|nr:TRAP transporter fused permease subunit [Deltaproteobacteria bacterium]
MQKGIDEGGGSKVLDISIAFISIAMVAYHLIMTRYLLELPQLWMNTHLAFALVISFLVSMKSQKKKWWPLSLFMIALSLISTVYIKLNFERLQFFQGWPNKGDVVIGVILLVVVIEAARRMQGIIFPVLSLIFLGYGFLGNYLPQPLWHEPFSPERIIAWLTVSFGGIYGKLLGISAKYIFLFMLFGALLETAKTVESFSPLAKMIGKKFAGGAGHSAVVSSALVGTVTGVGLANVAITGAFTIPMMKKHGYRPEQAAAIEASASIGGQIMPPVMGAAAFLMVAFTGIPYVRIILAGLIPAILYFLSIGIGVQLRAKKEGLTPPIEEIDWKGVALRAPVFVAALTTLTYFLLKGHTPMFAAFYAVISILAVSILVGLVKKEARISFQDWINGFIKGAIAGARIGVGIGSIGIVVGVVLFSGLGPKFALLVKLLSSGMMAPALVLTMVLCIILGMGMPVTAAYILVAVVAVPGLVTMGVDLLSAHFFAFYYAVLGAITPPVAGACIVAAPMANASYIRTAFRATGLALAGIILPFLFIWNPSLLMYPTNPFTLGITLVSSMITILCLQIIITNFYIMKLRFWEMVLAALTTAAFLGYLFAKM